MPSKRVHTLFMKHIWNEYVTYLKDNPEGYWFKRKLYGWGWTPAKPAGWVVVGTYLLFVFGLVIYTEKTGYAKDDPFTFLALVAAATVLLIVIAWRTGEHPKWQWGKHRD